MLSLSIFSSSQRISVALYYEKNLKRSYEQKIDDKKIDSIFLLLRKVLINNKKRINRVFFSVGPGSYTALRSIKAIAQGISMFYDSKIVNVTDFEIFLSEMKDNKNDVLVFFETFNKKFFYQVFKPYKNIYKANSNYLNGDLESLNKFITNKTKQGKKWNLVSDSRKNFSFLRLKDFEKKKIVIPCAKKMANAIFSGYGSKSKEILYHHTYYE